MYLCCHTGLFPLFWLCRFFVVEHVKTYFIWRLQCTCSCMFVDFSSGKAQQHAGYFLQKKKGSHCNTNVSLQISLMHSHLVLASVFPSKFCCDVYAFHKMLFFLLVLSSVSGVAHFIHSLPLLIFCPECLVIVANKG